MSIYLLSSSFPSLSTRFFRAISQFSASRIPHRPLCSKSLLSRGERGASFSTHRAAVHARCLFSIFSTVLFFAYYFRFPRIMRAYSVAAVRRRTSVFVESNRIESQQIDDETRTATNSARTAAPWQWPVYSCACATLAPLLTSEILILPRLLLEHNSQTFPPFPGNSRKTDRK